MYLIPVFSVLVVLVFLFLLISPTLIYFKHFKRKAVTKIDFIVFRTLTILLTLLILIFAIVILGQLAIALFFIYEGN